MPGRDEGEFKKQFPTVFDNINKLSKSELDDSFIVETQVEIKNMGDRIEKLVLELDGRIAKLESIMDKKETKAKPKKETKKGGK